MGDEFSVKTSHLRGYATQVSRSGQHADGVGAYIDGTCGNTDGWSGLLSLMVDAYQGMVSTGGVSCRELSKSLTNTARSLEATAHDYDTADNDAAVEIAIVGEPIMGPSVPAAGPGGSESYADVSEPTSALVGPASYDDTIAAQVDEIGGIIGLFNDVYEMITGDSLLAKIVEPVSGDWGKVYGLADCWDHVGDAYSGIGSNLAGGAGRMSPFWDGVAADAFSRHIEAFLTHIGDLDASTAEVSNTLRDLAENTRENFDVIIQTLNTVWSIISAAMASFAIPVYGQAKLAKAVWDTAKLIWNIYKIINLLRQLVSFVVEMTELVSEIFNETGALPQAGR